jgi:hypothetical protein
VKKLLLATAMSVAMISTGYAQQTFQSVPTCGDPRVIQIVEQLSREQARKQIEKMTAMEIYQQVAAMGFANMAANVNKTIPGVTVRPGRDPDPEEMRQALLKSIDRMNATKYIPTSRV